MTLRRLADRAQPILAGNVILDLTPYEVGNAIWTDIQLRQHLTAAEGKTLLGLLKRILADLRLIRIEDLRTSEVLDAGLRHDLTFYDAAYLDVARRNEYDLATEDDRLRRVAKRYVKTLSADRLIAQ